ncbi:SAM-dependent methyltransferase [Actinocrinis sp.]|uniref:SAM-dependent methyltransferase n=1 Tax=Actinocrinis sp. TaxID=1920516 RepID=UPI002D1918A6|nr:SAM-dependent methyltransferase [Actinocrinis sp.]HXR70307.1 SAM-dependent methyltransferase [Actinocrinis sp.]
MAAIERLFVEASMLDGEPPTSDDPPILGEGLLEPGWAPGTIDTSIPHPARMYDYYLGGKDNYQVDRDAAEEVLAILPEGRDMARANRAFLGRTVRYLARKGIKQFLDIGTGIPGPDNTNDVAHAVQPEARVVYVDNDPIVLTHASALLARHDPKYTTVIQADLRDPESIIDHPEAKAVLDFSQPIGVLLVAVLHFVKHQENPHALVDRLKQIMVPGSYLVLSHGTNDFEPERANSAVAGYNRASAPFVLRNRQEITRFFDGLELVEPGVVQIPWWQPDAEVGPDAEQIWIYGGIGYKP